MNPNPMEYGSYESGYINAAGYRDSKCVVGNLIRQVEDMAQLFSGIGTVRHIL